MARRIKGITIELDGETKGLDKALQDVNKRSRDAQTELRQVDRLLKFNPKNTELLAQKQKLLGDQVEATREKLNKLKDAEADVQAQFERGEISEEQYRAFQREIVETESKLKHFEGQLEDTKSRFDKFAEGMTKAGDKLQDIGGKMKSAGGTMSKFVTGPIVGAGTAMVGLAAKAGEIANKIQDAATAAGVSTDAYQELQYALQRHGVSEDQVGRLLERNTQRMGRAAEGNKKFKEAYKDLGVEIESSNGELRDSEEVFDDLLVALADIEDPAIRAAKAGDLLGTNAGRKLAGALDGGVESIDEAREAAQELGIVMDETAMKEAIEFSNAMDDLKQQFGAAFREIGTKLIPILTDQLLPVVKDSIIPAIQEFGDWIGNIIEWFADLSPSMQKTIITITGLVAAIGPLLMLLGSMSAGMGVILKIIPTLITSVGLLGKALMFLAANPVGLVITAIAALIAIGIAVWKNWDTIKEKSIEIWGAIAEWFSEVWDWIKDVFSSALGWIDDKTGGAFSEYLKIVKRYMELVWDNIKAVWDWVKNTFSNALDFIKALVTGDFEGMKDAIKSQMENSEELIRTIWDNVMKFFGDIDLWQIGKDIIQGLINGIGSMGRAVWDAAKGIASSVKDSITSFLGVSSPAKELIKIGEWTGEGLEIGIGSKLKDIQRMSQRMSEATLPDVSGGSSQLDLTELVDAINRLAGRDVVLAINDREFARATGGAMAIEIQGMKKDSARGRGIR